MSQLKHVVKIFTLVFLLSIAGLPAEGQDNIGELVHIVVDIEGQAEIEYTGGGVSMLTVGSLVRPEDVILLGIRDQVIILCADLQLDSISRSSRPPNCAVTITDPIWNIQGLPVVDRQRSTGYESIPYLISPRNTRLLEPDPTIHWQAIEEAESYRVSVFLQDGTLLWEEEVSDNNLPYPARYEYLRALDNAGNPIRYEIIITALDASSRPIATRIDPGIREPISVLPPGEERRRIESQLVLLADSPWVQSTDENILPYSEALYLYGEGLYSDALEHLRPLILDADIDAGNISTSPALYLLLADIFVDTNLPVEAASNYLKAQEISSELGDVASEARALSGLGSLSSGDEANSYYTESARLYRLLGEDDLADDIESGIN